MFKLDVIDSRVRRCEDVSTIVDKKMRTRTIKFEKFIIPLSDNNPFELNEFVKVLRKSDFEKIGNMLKSLKSEREQLKKQINELTILSETQRNIITSRENSSNNEAKDNDKTSIFKDLIRT